MDVYLRARHTQNFSWWFFINISLNHFSVTKTAAPKAAPKAKKLPAVPESKLKAQKQSLSSRVLKLKRNQKKQATIALRRQQNLKRAEIYAKRYLAKDREVVEQLRTAKKEGKIVVAAEPKLAFVMRIRGWVIKGIW